MKVLIAKKISVLKEMTIGELREKYREIFGEEPRSFNKRFYLKRIAWRLQASENGTISERALRRAAELVDENDLRIRPPKPKKEVELAEPPRQYSSDSRLPIPGTILTRKYRGRIYRITVLQNAFEYEGQQYRTLTAVAKTITGSHWNGFSFFGLEKKGKSK